MSRRKRPKFSLRKTPPAGKTLRRRLLIWLGGTALVLLLLLVVGYFQLIAYLRGDDFRRSLEESLCNQCRAESVSIPSPLSIEGASVGLDAASLHRADAVQSLGISDIRAQIRRWPLLDRCLHVTDLCVAASKPPLTFRVSTSPYPIASPMRRALPTASSPSASSSSASAAPTSTSASATAASPSSP